MNTGSKKIELRKAGLARFNTKAKLESEAKRQLGQQKLQGIFFHINRNGSIAIATGAEPDIWPEDVPPPDNEA